MSWIDNSDVILCLVADAGLLLAGAIVWYRSMVQSRNMARQVAAAAEKTDAKADATAGSGGLPSAARSARTLERIDAELRGLEGTIEQRMLATLDLLDQTVAQADDEIARLQQMLAQAGAGQGGDKPAPFRATIPMFNDLPEPGLAADGALIEAEALEGDAAAFVLSLAARGFTPALIAQVTGEPAPRIGATLRRETSSRLRRAA
jgi:hypothetical protein